MAESGAYCRLLWIHNGGNASGYCGDPTDCYRCHLLQREISLHPPGHANWVCPACLSEVCRRAKAQGKSIHLTQHYSEGQCEHVGCTRPPRMEYRDIGVGEDDAEVGWTEEDLVEKPRGFSRFLQLVIGDINT